MLIISIIIILLGLVVIVQDLKQILKEEPIHIFILKVIGFMLCGSLINILLSIVF